MFMENLHEIQNSPGALTPCTYINLCTLYFSVEYPVLLPDFLFIHIPTLSISLAIPYVTYSYYLGESTGGQQKNLEAENYYFYI